MPEVSRFFGVSIYMYWGFLHSEQAPRRIAPLDEEPNKVSTSTRGSSRTD